MAQPDKNISEQELAKRALRAADLLASAVITGAPGQQRLALDYARALDDAKRAGLNLTNDT